MRARTIASLMLLLAAAVGALADEPRHKPDEGKPSLVLSCLTALLLFVPVWGVIVDRFSPIRLPVPPRFVLGIFDLLPVQVLQVLLSANPTSFGWNWGENPLTRWLVPSGYLLVTVALLWAASRIVRRSEHEAPASVIIAGSDKTAVAQKGGHGDEVLH